MADQELELVLLPGLDGTGTLFWRLERLLTALIPSRALRYPYDPDLGYDELAGFVAAEIAGRNVILLGESFSGPIAVELSSRYAKEVRGLVLAATFLQSPYPRSVVRTAAVIEPKGRLRRWVNPVLMGLARDPELVDKVTQIMNEMPPSVRERRLREVSQIDVRGSFAAVRCPILVLHGTHDWLVPHRAIVRAVRSKASARLKMLAGPHMLLQRNAADAAREIEAFISSIGPTA